MAATRDGALKMPAPTTTPMINSTAGSRPSTARGLGGSMGTGTARVEDGEGGIERLLLWWRADGHGLRANRSVGPRRHRRQRDCARAAAAGRFGLLDHRLLALVLLPLHR